MPSPFQQVPVSWSSFIGILGILTALICSIAGAGYAMHASQPHAGAIERAEYTADQGDLKDILNEIKATLIRIEGRLDSL